MYPSDLKDEKWDLIAPFFKRTAPRGAGEKHPERITVNAILYLLKTGAHRRMLPNDFPPWSTVHEHFRKRNLNGTWEKVADFINIRARISPGRQAEPAYGLVDSQSARTRYASGERDFDGNKKVKGRKRHICADTQGNLLCVQVHAANISDTEGVLSLLGRTPENIPIN